MSSNRVFVGHLNEFITDADLAHFFRRCGKIIQVIRRVDHAFVDFEDMKGADVAIRELHNTVLCGCTVTVEPAIFNRGVELAVSSNVNKKAAYPEPSRSRWDKEPTQPVSQRDLFNSSRSVIYVSTVQPSDPNSSTFGCRSPQKTAPTIKVETCSPVRPSTDTAIQGVEQIDVNVIEKSTAEVEIIGLSELAKRSKAASHLVIDQAEDPLKATITDTLANKFEIPDCFSDCELLVEGKVLHANKSLLSIYSAKLHALFNSTKSNKITLGQDIGLEEVLVILDFIYPCNKRVTAANLECLLKMANKLEIPSATERCELFLTSESTLSLTKKLYLAQLYGLHSFKVNCINQCDSIKKLRLLKIEKEYEFLDGNTMRLLIESATAEL
uniref:BTB domain-containing protein n=1 Tax=Ditylenchus dipsaci TaxID=166011 RepID=A0A915EH59_9BILA